MASTSIRTLPHACNWVRQLERRERLCAGVGAVPLCHHYHLLARISVVPHALCLAPIHIRPGRHHPTWRIRFQKHIRQLQDWVVHKNNELRKRIFGLRNKTFGVPSAQEIRLRRRAIGLPLKENAHLCH